VNPQAREAGIKGCEVTRARAEFKRELKISQAPLLELLYEPDLPDWFATMHLHDVLTAIPLLMAPEADLILSEIPIKLCAATGDTTYRKRRLLKKALEVRGAGIAEQRRERRARPAHLTYRNAGHATHVRWECGELTAGMPLFARFCTNGGEHGPTQTVSVLPASASNPLVEGLEQIGPEGCLVRTSARTCRERAERDHWCVGCIAAQSLSDFKALSELKEAASAAPERSTE
jgi:hypothetical protein